MKTYHVIGDGTGPASRIPFDMAADLLGHAKDMLADERTTPVQIRYLAVRMAASLRDVLRCAERNPE